MEDTLYKDLIVSFEFRKKCISSIKFSTVLLHSFTQNTQSNVQDISGLYHV